MSHALKPGGGQAGDAPHVIRLRRPWLCEPASSSTSKLVSYTRRFAAPSNLTADDLVELVVSGIGGLEAISLNSWELQVDPSAAEVRVDITPLLSPRNELRLAVHTAAGGAGSKPPPPADTWQDSGAVHLAIRQRG